MLMSGSSVFIELVRTAEAAHTLGGVAALCDCVSSALLGDDKKKPEETWPDWVMVSFSVFDA